MSVFLDWTAPPTSLADPKDPKAVQRQLLHDVAEYVRSVPDQSFIPQFPSLDQLPPVPTKDGTDKYFYLHHLPGDVNVHRPDINAKIVESGGVGANVIRTEGADVTFDYLKLVRDNEAFRRFVRGIKNGLDNPSVAATLLQYPGNSIQDRTYHQTPSTVNWFYCVRPIPKTEYPAWKDKLVFRVPVAWLWQQTRENATKQWDSNPNGLFVTRRVVPLKYRLVKEEDYWQDEDHDRVVFPTL